MTPRHKITVHKNRMYKAVETEYLGIYSYTSENVNFFTEKVEILTSKNLVTAIEDAKTMAEKYFKSLESNKKIAMVVKAKESSGGVQTSITDFAKQHNSSDDFLDCYLISYAFMNALSQETTQKTHQTSTHNSFSQSFFNGANEAVNQSSNSWQNDADYSQDTYNYNNDSSSNYSDNGGSSDW